MNTKLEFLDKTVGTNVPKNFIPAIKKVRQILHVNIDLIFQCLFQFPQLSIKFLQ